jgi:hypothetical protein
MTLVCADVKFPDEDHGSAEDGNASSEDGSGTEEEGKGSAGVEDNASAVEGSGAASIDGAGSVEGSVGSDHAGTAASSTDSCAWAARMSEKEIAATIPDVLPAIRRTIWAVVVAAVLAEKGAKR